MALAHLVGLSSRFIGAKPVRLVDCLAFVAELKVTGLSLLSAWLQRCASRQDAEGLRQALQRSVRQGPHPTLTLIEARLEGDASVIELPRVLSNFMGG